MGSSVVTTQRKMSYLQICFMVAVVYLIAKTGSVPIGVKEESDLKTEGSYGFGYSPYYGGYRSYNYGGYGGYSPYTNYNNLGYGSYGYPLYHGYHGYDGYFGSTGYPFY